MALAGVVCAFIAGALWKGPHQFVSMLAGGGAGVGCYLAAYALLHGGTL